MYTYREREGEPWKQPNMFAIEDFPSGISFFCGGGRPTWKLKVVDPRIARWTHLDITFSTPMVSMDCWIVKSTS